MQNISIVSESVHNVYITLYVRDTNITRTIKFTSNDYLIKVQTRFFDNRSRRHFIGNHFFSETKVLEFCNRIKF